MPAKKQAEKKAPQEQKTTRVSENKQRPVEGEHHRAEFWTGLPAQPANRGFRQNMLLDIQAKRGNAYAIRFLTGSSIQRKEFTDLKPATLKKMKTVQHLPIPLPNEESITKKEKHSLGPVKIIFGKSVPAKVHVALNNVAIDIAFAQSEMKPFTTYTADIDLTKIGGGKNIYRISRYKESKKEFILIELVGPSGVSESKSKTDSGKKKFKKYGFRMAGFGDDDKEHVYSAVALISDSSLSRVAGLSFVRKPRPTHKGADPDAGGNYFEKTHTIALYNRIFVTNITSGQIKAIVHEIGHAISLQSAATGYKEKKEAEAALKKARKISVKDIDDPLGGIGESKSDEEKKAEAKLKDAKAKIARAKDGSNSPTFKSALASEGEVSKYGKKNKEEAFAEAYTLFIVDPVALKAMRPITHGYFVNLDIYFENPDKLKKSNKALHTEFKKYYGG